MFLKTQATPFLDFHVKFARFTNWDCGPRGVSINEVLVDVAQNVNLPHGKTDDSQTRRGRPGRTTVFGVAAALSVPAGERQPRGFRFWAGAVLAWVPGTGAGFAARQ